MITFKKIVKFTGSEGEPLVQGILYWNKKEIGFVSQTRSFEEDIIPEECYRNEDISTFLEKSFDLREESIEINEFYKNIVDLKNSMTVTEKIDSEVIDLLLDYIDNKQMKKDCKKYTLFTLHGDTSTYKIKVMYDKIVKIHLEKEYKEKLKEVINERYI